MLEEPRVLDGGRAALVQHAAPQELLPQDGLSVCGIERGIPEGTHHGYHNALVDELFSEMERVKDNGSAQ